MKDLLDNALRVVKDVGWKKGAYVCGSEVDGVEGVCLIGALGWAYEDALDMAAWKMTKQKGNAPAADSIVNDVIGDGRLFNEMYAVAKAIERIEPEHRLRLNYTLDQVTVHEDRTVTLREVVEAHRRNGTSLLDLNFFVEAAVDYLIDYIAGWNDKEDRTLDDITTVLKDAEEYLDA